MIAMAWESTGCVAVFNADKPMQFNASSPLIKGHTGKIQDIAWNPFEDRLLATSADDGKLKLWVFDDYEGCMSSGDKVEAELEIDAHSRKCLTI